MSSALMTVPSGNVSLEPGFMLLSTAYTLFASRNCSVSFSDNLLRSTTSRTASNFRRPGRVFSVMTYPTHGMVCCMGAACTRSSSSSNRWYAPDASG